MAPLIKAILFSAVLSLFSFTHAFPTSFSVASPAVNPDGPLHLFTVDRPDTVDTDGSGAQTAITANQSFTPLSFQQPDGPATDGQRFLAPIDSFADAFEVTVLGGYIRTLLPIPRSDPLQYANWTSINDNAFPQGSAQPVGGRVNFTTVNEGADGGLEVDGRTGAIYVHDETDNYAAWTLCNEDDSTYLAFAGTASTSCKNVYLVGAN